MTFKPENFVCYLPIEVKARELDTKIYLALKLVQKGFCVVIGGKPGLNKHMFYQKKPFIYVDKGISKGSSNFYKAIKSSNGLLVEIQEEGNIRLDSEIIIRIHNNFTANLFSLIFTWSNRAKEVIEKECPIINNVKVVASGHPSFDMLHDDLIEYFKKIRKLNSKIKSGYILINTNFSTANGIITFNDMRSYNIKDKEFHTEKEKKKYEASIEFEKKILSEFLKMIKAVSDTFIDKIIIVRPHPMENKNFYEEEFKENKNIKVIFEGSSKQWIADADVIIHHDCTTGVEAFIAGKKVISFCPYHDSNHVIKLPQDVSVKLNNIESIINYIKIKDIKDHLDREKKNLELLKLTKNINSKNQKATDVIVSNLVELCNTYENKKRLFLKKWYYYLKFKILNKIGRIMIKSNASINTMRKKKFNYLKKEELEEKLNSWYELLPTEKILVEELEKDTFLLKK